jgi:hypothetical protein
MYAEQQWAPVSWGAAAVSTDDTLWRINRARRHADNQIARWAVSGEAAYRADNRIRLQVKRAVDWLAIDAIGDPVFLAVDGRRGREE